MALFLMPVLFCFDPPEDEAHNVKASLKAPSEVRITGSPFEISVLIENGNDTGISGELEVWGIDRWKVNGEEVFRAGVSVEGRGSAEVRLSVSPWEGSYEALYPLHARFSFELNSELVSVHPVAVLSVVENRLVKREAAELPAFRPPRWGINERLRNAFADYAALAARSAMLKLLAEMGAGVDPSRIPEPKFDPASADSVKEFFREAKRWLATMAGILIEVGRGAREVEGKGVGVYEFQHALAVALVADGEPRALSIVKSPAGLFDTKLCLATPRSFAIFDGFDIEVKGEGFKSARYEIGGDGFELIHELEEGEIGVRVGAAGGCFIISFELRGEGDPRKRITLLRLRRCSKRAVRVYAGPGNVIVGPQRPFVLQTDGHRLSTRFVAFDFEMGPTLLQAVDIPPDCLEVDPQNHLYSLRAQLNASFHLLPTDRGAFYAAKAYREFLNPKPAPSIGKLAGRFVFDLWGGYRYSEVAEELEKSFKYGLSDAVVVYHNWQRWGYDYRLPDILPPNPRFGGAEEFKRLIDTCRRYGVLFAPHDNYIDFYPDATDFSYDHICFAEDGRPVRAWFNRSRGAQSYRFRPDRILPFVRRNMELMKQFAPTAYFVDVFASIGPFDYFDREGGFHPRTETVRRWGEAFDLIREELGGAPQISESGGDWLVGHLEGAQANHLRVDKPPEGGYSWAVWDVECVDAERIPWFDVVYHHAFILQGAGYEPRYAAGLDPEKHGIYSDDYISTEVLTGRPPMVSKPFGGDVVRKYWLLHDFARAVAAVPIESVEFYEDDIHRQIVRYSNGAVVYVNRGDQVWEVEGVKLPKYGFYARCGEIKAMVVQPEEGVRLDLALSPSSLFVNVRSKREIDLSFLRTDGGFRVEAVEEGLRLVLLPERGSFSVTLRLGRLPIPAPEKVDGVSEIDVDGRRLREIAYELRGDELSFRTSLQAFGYIIEGR